MNITNAQVSMQSAYAYQQKYSSQLEVEVRQNNPNINTNNNSLSTTFSELSSIADFSKQALNQLEIAKSNSLIDVENSTDNQALAQLELEVAILKMVVERLTGKKMFFVNLDFNSLQLSIEQFQPKQISGPLGLETSLRIDYSELYEELESVSFNAQAIINTLDGESLEIDFSISQSRSYSVQNNFNLRIGEAFKDPLILNFDASAAELSEQTFEFDLSLDGLNDAVPILSNNSAYLALDKNNDGEINDGNELFGPKTGNGFNELAQYDDDNNRWIDESDAVYSKLRLWNKSEASEVIFSLQDKDVGAIYLGNIATPFTLTNHSNEATLGQARTSGIYLTNSSQARLIQQIDLKI